MGKQVTIVTRQKWAVTEVGYNWLRPLWVTTN